MIENLKDLERALKLCRKHGVTQLGLGNTYFILGELPSKESVLATEEEADNAYEDFPEGELSPEELTFFASGGLAKDNPYRK